MWRFPHLGRVGKVGGVDRVTAEQENGKLLMGMPALQIPIMEWYDPMVHLMVHESFMKSPEFLQIPPDVQQQFYIHWQGHKQQLQFIQAQQLAQQLQAQRLEQQSQGVGSGSGAAAHAAGAPDEEKQDKPAADAA
jgi:hypothetical protein